MTLDDDELHDVGEWLNTTLSHDMPREPGRFTVRTNGEPTTYRLEVTCDYCGRVLRCSGVQFGELPPCSMHPGAENCLHIHCHWGEDCPAWRWRISRLRTAITWPVERRWRSWQWKRRSKVERADPEAWKNYWADLDEDDA